MKFHKLNIKANELLNLKQSNKIKTRRIYCLIKEHNKLCLMLNNFNDFWKKLLVFVFSYYVLFIWFSFYVPTIYSDLKLIPRLFMHFNLVGVIVVFSCITFVIFNVSSEVN